MNNIPDWGWLVIAVVLFLITTSALVSISLIWRGPNEDSQIDAPPPMKHDPYDDVPNAPLIHHDLDDIIAKEWADESITEDTWWR